MTNLHIFTTERVAGSAPARADALESAHGPLQGENLRGFSVLVIEDDYFVATDCADILRTHGAEVLGPVPDMQRAHEIATERRPDCVLLDINLKGVLAFGLAEGFLRDRIPLVITTGYDASTLPSSLRRAPCLLKPIEARELLRVVKREISARKTPRT
jgi:CheY-like chemotaxis protein